MGENRYSLDSELLISQSQRMANLKNQYEALFQNVSRVLDNMNENWSENLSHNFSGKITTARNSFLKIGSLLQIGSDAARESATSFASLDECLARSGINEFLASFSATAGTAALGGSAASKIFGTFDPGVLAMDSIFSVPIHENWDKAKELMGYYDLFNEGTEGKIILDQIEKWEKEYFGSSTISELRKVLSITSDVFHGELSWDTADTLIDFMPDQEGKYILQYTKDMIEVASKNGEGTYLGDRRTELNDRMNEQWAEGDYFEAVATVTLGTTEAALNFMGEVGYNFVEGQVENFMDNPLVSYVNDQIPWSDVDKYFQDTVGFSPATVFDEIGIEMRKELSSRVNDTLDAISYISDEASKGVFDYIKDLF